MLNNYLKKVDSQKLVQRIGVADIVVQIFGILAYSAAGFANSNDLFEILNNEDKFKFNLTDCKMFWKTDLKNETSCDIWPEIGGISSNVVGIIIHACELYLAFKLIHGAETRDDRKCHKWLIYNVLLATLEFGVNGGQLAVDGVVDDEMHKNRLILMYSVPSILYKLGSCGVVSSFVKDVRLMRSENISNRRTLEANGDIEVSNNLLDRNEDVDPLLVY